MSTRLELDLAGVKKLAENLAKKYQKRSLVLGLVGPLGAGKTTFVKHFAQALNISGIKSPSFTILTPHKFRSGTLYHLDFYRLKKMNELETLGIRELLSEPHRIVLIEWVDRFPVIRRKCNLIIKFEIISHDKRNITIKRP